MGFLVYTFIALASLVAIAALVWVITDFVAERKSGGSPDTLDKSAE